MSHFKTKNKVKEKNLKKTEKKNLKNILINLNTCKQLQQLTQQQQKIIQLKLKL